MDLWRKILLIIILPIAGGHIFLASTAIGNSSDFAPYPSKEFLPANVIIPEITFKDDINNRNSREYIRRTDKIKSASHIADTNDKPDPTNLTTSADSVAFNFKSSNPDSLHGVIDSLRTADDSLRIGLALSGGGARGLAHIGVLQVLEEYDIEVDYLVGSSMGSIIGGLYAMKYSADSLTTLAKTINWNRLFSEQIPRTRLPMLERLWNERFLINLPINKKGIQLPEGLITGQHIHSLLISLSWPYHSVTDFSQLPISYAATATNLANGELVLLDSGYLPDAMRASMAIPSIFTPYKIDDQLLIDGGFARSLPATEVQEMGANFIISVDVTKPLKPVDSLTTMTAIMNQVINFRNQQEYNQQLAISNLVIDPNITSYNIGDFDQAEALMETGRQAALKQKDILKLLSPADSNHASATVSGPPASEPRIISQITIEGLKDLTREHILNEFQLPLHQPVTSRQIKEAVDRLFNTRFFDQITYRTLPVGDNTFKLILTVDEKDQDQFKLGLRYDTDSNASLISQLSFRNLLHRGSTARLQSRLGDVTSVSGEYTMFRGIRPRTGIRTLINYRREDISWYRDGDPVSSFISHQINTELTTGTYFSDHLLFSGGISRDWNSINNIIGGTSLPFSDQQAFHSLIGQLWFDSLNRLTFPTEGNTLLAEFEFSDNIFYSSLDFSRQHLYWTRVIPLFEPLTIHPELRLGRTTGRTVPFSHWFYLQRTDPRLGYLQFAGYHDRELHGRNMQMAGFGLQLRVGNQKFIKIHSQIGNTFTEWPWDPWNHSFKQGMGLSIGALTFAGPIKLTVSRSQRHPLLFFFQAGYPF